MEETSVWVYLSDCCEQALPVVLCLLVEWLVSKRARTHFRLPAYPSKRPMFSIPHFLSGSVSGVCLNVCGRRLARTQFGGLNHHIDFHVSHPLSVNCVKIPVFIKSTDIYRTGRKEREDDWWLIGKKLTEWNEGSFFEGDDPGNKWITVHIDDWMKSCELSHGQMLTMSLHRTVDGYWKTSSLFPPRSP